jgi:hypothetical protein
LTAHPASTTICCVSQYPPSYPQPPYSQPGIDFSQYVPASSAELLAPARRAAILQGVLGCMLLLCGVCIGSVFWMVDPAQAFAQSGMDINKLTGGQGVEVLRVAYTVFGTIGGLIGVALLVLAMFVYRGGFGPIVISIVICSLVTLVLVVNLIGPIVMVGTANPMAVAGSVMMVGIPLFLFGLNLRWLATAARNSSRIALARQQYQAQFYQYQYQQQAYGVPGAPYGYGLPNPPAPAGTGYGYPTAAAPTSPPVPTSPPPQSGDVNDPPAAR